MSSVETHRIEVSGGECIAVDWTPPAAGGPGRVAVFVHGLGSHRRGEKALHFAERFAAQGWGFLAVDLRGHGDADGRLRDLTFSASLADLAAALAFLPAGTPPPVLIGSSMGGAVAAWHLLNHPEQASPLVLIAPSLAWPGRLQWLLGPAEIERWREAGTRTFGSEWLAEEIGFQLFEDGLQYEPQKLLVGHRHPALIFHGLQDTAVDWRASLSFLEDCPTRDLDLVLLKSGDHRLTDRKAFLFDTLWSWLQGRV